MIDFDMRFVNMSDLIPPNLTTLDLVWDMYMPKMEKGRQNESQWTSIYYKHYQDEVDDLGLRSKKEMEKEDIPTKLKWVGFKGQFFSSVFITEESFTNGLLTARNIENGQYIKQFIAELGVSYNQFQSPENDFRFYFGPNKYKVMKQYEDLHMSELVEMGGGIIRWINKFVIIPIFDLLNNSIANYGIIILLLTIIIKVALFPLTFRSYLSQARMRVLKPQVDRERL